MITLPPEVATSAEDTAAREGQTLSALIEEALRDVLRRRGVTVPTPKPKKK